MGSPYDEDEHAETNEAYEIKLAAADKVAGTRSFSKAREHVQAVLGDSDLDEQLQDERLPSAPTLEKRSQTNGFIKAASLAAGVEPFYWTEEESRRTNRRA